VARQEPGKVPGVGGPPKPAAATRDAGCRAISLLQEEGMQIISGRQFTFSSNGSAQLRTQEFDVGFQVTSATAVIEGMDVEFANRNDHHLGRLQVFLSTEVAGPLANRVIVRANFGLRDWSGGSAGDDLNGDDPIRGTIQYSVLIA
jgi:hypothetical protein